MQPIIERSGIHPGSLSDGRIVKETLRLPY